MSRLLWGGLLNILHIYGSKTECQRTPRSDEISFLRIIRLHVVYFCENQTLISLTL